MLNPKNNVINDNYLECNLCQQGRPVIQASLERKPPLPDQQISSFVERLGLFWGTAPGFGGFPWGQVEKQSFERQNQCPLLTLMQAHVLLLSFQGDYHLLEVRLQQELFPVPLFVLLQLVCLLI